MLTADEAYARHIKMWTAMQKELGDNPAFAQRIRFKRAWCEDRGEKVSCHCYLCQYDEEHYGPKGDCRETCLIDWGGGCVSGKVPYMSSPISKILALPERKVNE